MQEEKLRRTLTRREFLKVSGAGVAGVSLLAGCERSGVLPDLPDNTPSADRATNVVLIIMDSLRKDHVGRLWQPSDRDSEPRRFRQRQPALRHGLPRVRA